MTFVGRLHPLIIHFPIALLLMAFAFEVLARRSRFIELKAAVLPTLLVGWVGAVFSVLTGIVLSGEGGYEDVPLAYHRWAGIATAAVSTLVVLAKWRFSSRKPLIMVLFITLTLLVVIAGHLGASLTHGEDFLTEYAPWNKHEEKPFELPDIANLDEAVMYTDIVRPLLEQRCYACHSAKRQKGDLRLDSEEFLKRGGKHGDLLTRGSSELHDRITLPLEAEHHMPPNEREQPSSAELELLIAWLEEGSDFNTKVSSMSGAIRIKTYWNVLKTAPVENWLPTADINAGDSKAMESLKSAGVLVLPVARNSNYLMVNFVNTNSATGVTEALVKLDKQIVDLRAEDMAVSDSLLTALGRLSNLRRLSLNNSEFDEQGLQPLFRLPELRYFNLVGTSVSDATLLKLNEMKNIRKVYLYNTRVTRKGIDSVQDRLPTLEIDTGGYDLPKLTTDTLVYRRKG